MKIIKAEEVGQLIKDNDMVAISGSGGSGSCEAILRAIRDSYIKIIIPKILG